MEDFQKKLFKLKAVQMPPIEPKEKQETKEVKKPALPKRERSYNNDFHPLKVKPAKKFEDIIRLENEVS